MVNENESKQCITPICVFDIDYGDYCLMKMLEKQKNIHTHELGSQPGFVGH